MIRRPEAGPGGDVGGTGFIGRRVVEELHPTVYELSRIRTELGYRESISLQEGMQRTLASLVANQPTLENWGLYRYLSHDPFDYAAEDAAMEAAQNG